MNSRMQQRLIAKRPTRPTARKQTPLWGVLFAPVRPLTCAVVLSVASCAFYSGYTYPSDGGCTTGLTVSPARPCEVSVSVPLPGTLYLLLGALCALGLTRDRN